MNTHLVRIFNTYGPRLQANDGRVISNLMTQALRGEPLTIYGEGLQTRSFCYVSDLIEGILRLSGSPEHTPVNIGNDMEWTILECAREVLAVTGADVEILFKPLPQDDPLRRRPDLTRARTLLGLGAQDHASRRPGTLTGLFSSLCGRRSLCLRHSLSTLPCHVLPAKCWRLVSPVAG